MAKSENSKLHDDPLANLKEEDIIHGKTLENIEQRCLDLCQAYIGGTWNQATSIADIEVKRISGGLTNQLYKVDLKDCVAKVPSEVYQDEPLVVAIKIYQPKHLFGFDKDETERLNDMVTLSIMSEVNIGPKVYGIFNDGFIQSYHKHEQFRTKHQQNPKLLRELANQIARTNYLNVPLRKNNNWMFVEMKKSLESGLTNPEVIETAKELNLNYIGKYDLRGEFEELELHIKQLNAPRVFCHNDFRGCNILVDSNDQSIKLVDLEYSSYGYRGFDLSTFLSEWDRSRRFDVEDNHIPKDSILENFIKLYIEACDRLMPGYSRKAENSLDKILNETKVFIWTGLMFFVAFMISREKSFIDSIPFDRKANLLQIDSIFGQYLAIKEKFINEGILKKNTTKNY